RPRRATGRADTEWRAGVQRGAAAAEAARPELQDMGDASAGAAARGPAGGGWRGAGGRRCGVGSVAGAVAVGAQQRPVHTQITSRRPRVLTRCTTGAETTRARRRGVRGSAAL